MMKLMTWWSLAGALAFGLLVVGETEGWAWTTNDGTCASSYAAAGACTCLSNNVQGSLPFGPIGVKTCFSASESIGAWQSVQGAPTGTRTWVFTYDYQPTAASSWQTGFDTNTTVLSVTSASSWQAWDNKFLSHSAGRYRVKVRFDGVDIANSVKTFNISGTDYEKKCFGTSVYWADACGTQRSFVETCPGACSGGTCPCNHACSTGEKRCYGSGYQQCTTGAGGCRVWSSTYSCDDGISCTSDSCNGGVCQHSANNSQCNDYNDCTSDTCSTSSGCQHSNLSGSCSDGDSCTQNDYCSSGSCRSGSAIVCNDNNACTDDYCSGGYCQTNYNSNSCNDGDSCTASDRCTGGSCQGTPLNCDDGNSCTQDYCQSGQCRHTQQIGQSCNDGNSCTQNDTCQAAGCVGVAMACNDNNPCTNDSCVNGGCVNQPTNGAACSDGNACTLSDVCTAGVCGGTPMDCADGNVCTQDACVGGACQNTAKAGPCNDGDACTSNDQCSNTFCVGGAPVSCVDGKSCTSDGCNPASGCSFTPVTGACSDGSACTENDQCVAGECVGGAAPNCDDANPCTDDACNPATGCQHTNNAAPCNDGLQCTTSDHCSGGQCVGALPAGCDDGIACTVDSCSESAGCLHTANHQACADGKPCTDNVCSLAEGGCVVTNTTGACDDNNPCTTGDSCNSGVCLPGGPTSCDDQVACTQDSCDPALGCVHAPRQLDCDDGIACTVDACDPVLGCGHVAVHSACDDQDPCTTDGCNEASGCSNALGALSCQDGDPCTNDVCVAGVGCQHPYNVAPCDDGDPCTVAEACALGACAGGIPKACDDGNPCTADVCQVANGGCLNPAIDGACDDGSVCTVGDTCIAKVCTGAPKVCNDGNPCTADSCDPHDGCVTSPAEGVACSDGNPCSVGDACANEVCLPGAPKACADTSACTVDSCDTTTGACVNDWTEGCCDVDADCGVVPGCNQSKCIAHQCQVIPGCVGTDACVFGGCYRRCDPPKDMTECGDSGATLFECLKDPQSGASGWVPSSCGGTDRCALNADTDRFECCTPNCAGRACGRPSACMASCGTCDERFACAGPNEPLKVDALHPDAFQCVPGCEATAEAVPEDEQTWVIEVPECGPPLSGTVGGDACPPCEGGTACYEGSCEDQCSIAAVTAVGQCSAKVAKWCEDGVPRELDCALEHSYCCAAGAPGNQIGQATCCGCAQECELKGWQCGLNSCNERCGLPDSDDGCAEGYDCQGRSCVCTIASLCGAAAEGDDADVNDGSDAGALDAAGAEVVEAISGTEDPAPGGCGGCTGGGVGGPWLFAAALALWLRRRRGARPIA